MSDPDTAERVTPTASAFVGHGNPMNALERNRYTEAWRTLGERVGRPRAILAVSAHWYIHATAVTAMPKPRTIHDFYGFPDELFAMRYPAPGSPEIAEEIADVVSPTWVGLDADSWGIDHGTWSVLVHTFPHADVPVLQLAINAAKPFEYHFEVGTRLAPLRERGIFVVGSGNVVHNLGLVDWQRPEGGEAWADRFDEAAIEVMTTDPGAAVGLADHPDHDRAVPTPDHFLPLLYVAGAAAATGEVAEVLVDGRVMGSLSMTAYTVGADTHLAAPRTGGDPPTLPEGTPPEETLT
jgi:4,5-DOPA dioxygenase extradiol